MSLAPWPPEYQIHISKRAKHVGLRFCPRDGLKLILPNPSSKALAIQFLNLNRHWVEKRLKEFQPREKNLPHSIHLRALDQQWLVRYEKLTAARKTKLIANAHEVVLYGKTFDYDETCQLLSQWLREKANVHLIEWTKRLSTECGLPFKNVTVRTQKTRWGSCTRDKEINLNDKLLFLPTYCVEYIIIHELCHTIHLNHSKKFWRLVEKFVPDHQTVRHELKKLQYELPDWRI